MFSQSFMKLKEIFVERITSGLNLWQKEFKSHDAILSHDPLHIEDHTDPHHPSILSLLLGSSKF